MMDFLKSSQRYGWSTVIAGTTLFAWVIFAVFAEKLAPFPMDAQNSGEILQSPSWSHWMGTDRLGRDLFSRVLFGGRISLAIGFSTALSSLLIGGFFGSIAGWYGGWVDRLLMTFLDIMYGLPTLVLMILVKMVLDEFSFFVNPEWRAFLGTFVALSFVGWMTLARLVRGLVLGVKESLYIDAGQALGFSDWDLVYRSVWPQIVGPVVVLTGLRIPSNILFESFLSFLGMGLKPPMSSWGSLAADGVDSLASFPHLILFPGGVLLTVLLAFQVLADTLKNHLSLRQSFETKDFRNGEMR